MDTATGQHLPRAPPEPAAYRFRGFVLDPARGVLRRPDGTEVALRPKSTEVLRHLARNASRVVPRDALMEAVWPGVFVTDDSITQCVVEIRHALGADGAHLLRTLPRRGYTLAAEVTGGDGSPPRTARFAGEAAAVAAAPPASPISGAGPAGRRWRPLSLLAGSGLLAVILAAAVGRWGSPAGPPNPAPPTAAEPPAAVPSSPPAVQAPDAAAPARPLSIVVLPFANLGGDPGQDHIADGVTDELTAALAQIPGSFVIGRGTAFAYKGLAVDVRRVGRDLGVRYVVQGSARRVGPQLRVNAQVIDAATGAHLWTEGFEEPLADIADLARAIASRIAAALSYALVWIEGDRARADRGHDPTAMDLLLRGRALLGSAPSMENLLEARHLIERSIALDEGSADAHAYLGMVLTNLWTQGWEEDREGLLRRAEEHATRALELNPRHARGHYVRGQVHQGRQRFDQALAEFEVALDLAPNHHLVHQRRGWVRNLTDRPTEAMADFALAVRISPRDPYVGTFFWGMAIASLMLGRDGDAAAHAMRAIAGNPTLPDVRLQLASALALVGRTEEARTALAEYHRLRPGTTVESFRRRAREVSRHPLWLATRDREAEALRAIGMPED
jgi:TolB-like protein/DNA-binding winged helix-turn-helix (wHTH) protein/Flp pilus assembly protein TadD